MAYTDAEINAKTGPGAASVAAATGTAPWGAALNTTAGYLGNFLAAGQVRAGSATSSWANVDVDEGIAAKDVRELDIDAVLALAETLDGDIDGKSNTGTSTVKEGEERFIFGASYSGQQGVSISETSGVSANYVRGKRVSWLSGDQWSYHKDGSAFSELEVDEMYSTTKAEGAVTSLISGAKSVKSISMSMLENASIRMSGANISSINVGTSTAEIVVAPSTSNAYLNFYKGVVNVAHTSTTFSTFALLKSVEFIVIGKWQETYAPWVIKKKKTPLAVTTCEGVEIESKNSVIETIVSKLAKIETQLQQTGVQISQLETALVSTNIAVEELGCSLETAEFKSISGPLSVAGSVYISDYKVEMGQCGFRADKIDSDVQTGQLVIHT